MSISIDLITLIHLQFSIVFEMITSIPRAFSWNNKKSKVTDARVLLVIDWSSPCFNKCWRISSNFLTMSFESYCFLKSASGNRCFTLVIILICTRKYREEVITPLLFHLPVLPQLIWSFVAKATVISKTKSLQFSVILKVLSISLCVIRSFS